MSLPTITTELGTVSQLDDRPNDTGGLTAAELKAKFDKDAGTIKSYVNDILIPYLESKAGAGSIGIETITGLAATEVQTALEQIIVAMQEITQGAVANASITLVKLAEEVTAVALGGAAASHTHDASEIISGTIDSVRLPSITTEKIADGAVTNAKLGEKSVAEANICTGAVTKDKIGALAVQATHIAGEAVTNAKLAANAVSTEKMADKSVTPAKLSGVTYSSIGLTTDQVRKITYGTADPSGGSDGDIYLQYS